MDLDSELIATVQSGSELIATVQSFFMWTFHNCKFIKNKENVAQRAEQTNTYAVIVFIAQHEQ